MATYLPNVTDYIPQVQPFQPDLNFYQQALALKQSQYDAGYNQLSKVYGTLLNSPLTHADNIARRDKFFTDISNDIKRISTLDLSKQENVDTAYKVFNPIITDKPFIKDMAFTKAGYSQMERGENMRNCLDEKKCGGRYWDGGIRKIKYEMQDFANASLEETLSFANPVYTPARNISKEAMEFAKEMGFSTDNLQWTPDGRYYYKTSNGVTAIPSLTDSFLAAFSNDQGIVDYYKAQGYLQRKDYMMQNAENFGSEEAAEQHYLNNFSKELEQMSAKELSTLETSQEFARIKKRVLEDYITTEGVDPNDPNDKKIIASYKQSTIDEKVAEAAKNVYKTTNENVAADTYDGADVFSKRYRIDAAVANGLLINDLHSAAQSYAMSTMKISDFTADPYRLASYESGLKSSLMDKELANAKELERYRTSLEMLKASYEDDGTGGAGGAGTSADEIIPGRPSASVEVEIFNEEIKAKNGYEANALKTAETAVKAATANLDRIINGKVGDYVQVNGSSQKVTVEMQKLAQKTKNQMLYGLLAPFAEDPNTIPTTDFGNASAHTGYKAVVDRMQELAKENPIVEGLIGDTKTIDAAKDAREMYYTYEKGVRTNVERATTATLAALKNEGDIDDKDWLFTKYHFLKADGGIKSPEQFAKEYATASHQEILQKTKNDYNNPRHKSWGGYSDSQRRRIYLWHLRNNTDAYMEQGKKFYEKFYDQFSAVYNNAPGQVATYEKIPLSSQYFAEGAGSGIQTTSTIRNVDVKNFNSEGLQEARYHMQNWPTAKAILINIDPLAESDDIEDAIDADDYQENQLKAKQIFQSIISASQDKDARKAADRPRFSMETTYLASPLKDGTTATRAVTFTLNPEYVAGSDGSDEVPGVTKGVQSITMFFSPEDIDSDPNNPFNINTVGKHGLEARVNRETSLSIDNGGSVTAIPGPNNNWQITGHQLMFDPNSGQFLTQHLTPTFTQSNTGENILDQVFENYRSSFDNLAKQNAVFMELYKMQNPNLKIKNPADL